MEAEKAIQLIKADKQPETIVYFVKLQFDNGLRISDLLAIKRADVLGIKKISVRQGKGSRSLLVDVSSDWSFWSKYKSGLFVDINLFSRQYFYRLYNRIGIAISTPIGKNNSVTHAPRKMLAQAIYTATDDLQSTAEALGHKSTNSTLYYLTPEQKKCEVQKGILGNYSGQISNIVTYKRKGVFFIKQI